jgi:haloalkane dehalogenase
LEHVAPPSLPDWMRRMLPDGIEQRSVDVGSCPMHVMTIGSGRTVLLLHGNPTWGFLYRKVAQELAGAPLRLVMPDLMGLGFSGRPPSGQHSIEQHARWLGTLVDALELRDLILVVQDWGGPIGLRLFAERPGLVKGLVLLNTVVGPPRPGFHPSAFHRLARVPGLSELAFRVLGFPQNQLHRVQGDPASIAGDVARAYRYPLRGLARNAAPLALARMVPDSARHPSIPPLERAQAFVTAFDGPVEVVWGERDPVLGRVVGWIERLLPRARVTRTPAGHFLQEEVPEPIAAAVRRVAAALAGGG